MHAACTLGFIEVHSAVHARRISCSGLAVTKQFLWKHITAILTQQPITQHPFQLAPATTAAAFKAYTGPFFRVDLVPWSVPLIQLGTYFTG